MLRRAETRLLPGTLLDFFQRFWRSKNVANNDQTPKVSIKKQARCYDTEAWGKWNHRTHEKLEKAKQANRAAIRRMLEDRFRD